MLELEGVDEMSTIISKEGNLVIDDTYLSLLVEEANKKLSNNSQRISSLLKALCIVPKLVNLPMELFFK